MALLIGDDEDDDDGSDGGRRSKHFKLKSQFTEACMNFFFFFFFFKTNRSPYGTSPRTSESNYIVCTEKSLKSAAKCSEQDSLVTEVYTKIDDSERERER